MRKIILDLAGLGVAGVAALTLGLGATASSERPLAELLRATHVHGLAVDRSDTGRLLLATHHGLHALRVEDGTVVPVTEAQHDFMGFTPHPAEADTLYASGHPAAGGNLGFIMSRDAGRTWERLSAGVGGPVDFHQMDVSKADPAVIYGAYQGLLVSRDGGKGWEVVGPAPDGLIDLAASAEAATRLYAATREGLMVSPDSGKSWQRVALPRRPVSSVKVTGDGTIYAFVLGSGLLRGKEGGSDWRTLSDDFGDRYLLHLDHQTRGHVGHLRSAMRAFEQANIAGLSTSTSALLTCKPPGGGSNPPGALFSLVKRWVVAGRFGRPGAFDVIARG